MTAVTLLLKPLNGKCLLSISSVAYNDSVADAVDGQVL